ncbi:MAG: VWA domain-containing protein [Planctomycetia bacterium]|nr:VWA domain-containing protein [Planctomycetia bacterium]
MNLLRFQNPYWLLLLIPLILVILLRNRRQYGHVFVFSNVSEFTDLPKTFCSQVRFLVPWLFYFGVALLIVALARPQKGREEYRVRRDGIAIAMCLDRSGSMQALDFKLDGKQVDRLAVVKQVFRDFVMGNRDFPGRPDDLIALIAFGGYVDSWCPLTLDHQTLTDMLAMIECPQPLYDRNGNLLGGQVMEEEAATAIGDALISSIDRLRNCKAKSRVIILLSDGAQNTGVVTAQEAAQVAKEFGIRIYTIGIGSSGPVPFPVYGPDGFAGYTKQILELDESTLREIAETADGQYFHVSDTDALRKVCARIDELERTEHEDRAFTKYNELYRWFLVPGALLIFLALALVFTRFRTVP